MTPVIDNNMATEMTWMQWKDQGSEHFQQAQEGDQSAPHTEPTNVKFYQNLAEFLMGLQPLDEASKECEKGHNLDLRSPLFLSRQKGCWDKLANKRQSKKSGSFGKDKWKPEIFDHELLTLATNDIEEVHPLAMLKTEFLVAAGVMRLRMPIRQLDIALKMFETAEEKGSISALYYIGMMHFRGQEGLKKDPVKAVTLWRRVAAEKPWMRINGELQPNLYVAQSECAIGDAFRHGIGVNQDDNEAFEWYKRSAEHGNGQGMANIASFVMTGRGGHLEPLTARIWFRKLIRSTYAKQEADPREDYSDDETAIHFNLFAKLSLFGSPIKTKKELHNTKVLAQMLEKRLQGWPTAKSFFQAYDSMNQARDLLVIYWQRSGLSRPFKQKARDLIVKKKYHESFQKLREIWRTWDFALEDYRPFLKAARQLLEKDPDDHSALYIVAICAPEDDFNDKLKMILKCLQLDPSVPDYHLMAAHLYAMNEDFEIALTFCDKALELLPHPSWLYTRAHLLQLVGPKKFSVKEMIGAFQLYLSSVPSDYSDVAEAYYSIAWLLGYNNEKDTEGTKMVYKMAQAAEWTEHRLPCFKDVEIYVADTKLEQDLMSENFDDEMAGKHGPTIFQVVCACCTNRATDPLFTCKTCKKTYYCSENCQKNNKIVHNMSCKK